MPGHRLERRQLVPLGLRDTFAFFERPENLAEITPPSLGFRIVTPPPIVMAEGLTIDYTVRVLGLRRRWRSRIAEYAPPHRFRDVQVIGPYRRWDHLHRFEEAAGGTWVEDLVEYALPFGPLGAVAHALLVRRQLDTIFEYRRTRLAALLGAPGGRAPA